MRISHDCFANFVADFRTTFVRVSHECRENFHVSRTRRELIAKVLNMFINFMRIFSPKYFARLSRDCHATIVRRSCECREPVAAKFWRIYNAKFLRHSHECRATVVRIKMKMSYIRGTVVRHSVTTVVRLSRDIREIYFQN